MIKKIQLMLFSLLIGGSAVQAQTYTALEKTGWTITASSDCVDTAPSGPIAYAIDGDVSTYWHSNWKGAGGNGNNSAMPEWFVVDMQEIKDFNAIGYTPRPGNANGTCREYAVYVSETAFDEKFTTWCTSNDVRTEVANMANPTLAGTFTIEGNTAVRHIATNGTQLRGRYIMFVIKNSGGNFGSCGEFDVLTIAANDPIKTSTTLGSEKLTDRANLSGSQLYAIKAVGGRPGYLFDNFGEGVFAHNFTLPTNPKLNYLWYVDMIPGSAEGEFYLRSAYTNQFISRRDVSKLTVEAADAMKFRLPAKEEASEGVFNLQTEGSYLNLNPAAVYGFRPTVYNDVNDANGKWELTPVSVDANKQSNFAYWVKDHTAITSNHSAIAGTPAPHVFLSEQLPDFVSVTYPTVNIIAGGGHYTLNWAVNLPFTASASYAAAQWKALRIHTYYERYVLNYDESHNRGNVYAYHMDGQTAYDGTVTPDAQLWAIVGNVWDGFKIYNKVAGESMTLRKADNGAISVMSTENTRNVFKAYRSDTDANDGFCLKIEGDGNYINLNVNDADLVLNSWSNKDQGSTFKMLEPTVLPAGKFYRMRSRVLDRYISVVNTTDYADMVVGCDGANLASTILYLTPNRKLMSYNTGYFFQRGGIKFNQMIDAQNLVATIIPGKQEGYFNTNVQGSTAGWLHGTPGTHSSPNKLLVCSNNTCQEHDFAYEPVTALPVTIGQTGYATFFAPVAVNLPEGLKAYTVTLTQSGDKNLAEGAEITGAIPASTGVLLAGTAGETYSLELDYTSTATASSALTGRYDTHNVAADVNAYVLTKPATGNLSFYKMTSTTDRTVKGGKAYLVVEADASGAPAFFLFSFGDLTGIGSVETSGSAEGAAYDLSGRRVATPRKGLYIVGGKKVLVK